ncbi:MAG: FG-GAP-like repeat-containing protein, partial [Planctomycetota bacterium]
AGAAATVATGGTFTRSGSFVDPGDNNWTATVNYGDGAGAVALTLNADKTFSLSHTYNTAGTFPVTIIVNDGTTPTTATFNVSVAPLTLALSANTVIEQSAAGAVIGALSTGNTALDTSATFTLLDNAGGRFALNGRNLVVSNGALLNVAAATSHSVNVRVTNGTATFDKTFPIQVVTGDKGDDFIGRDPITGQIFVARSTGSGFVTTNYQGGFTPTKNWVDILTGDFDGNGFDDVVGRDAATGQWSLAKNTGTTFVLSPWTTWSATATWVDVMAADMNGDGKIDVIGRNRATGEWICAFSQGTTAGSEIIGKWDPTKTWVQVKAIDVNHDNRTDVVGLQAGTGKFFTSLNQTSTTIVGGAKLNNLTSPWANLTDGNLESRTTWVDVQMADIDGDGRIDYVGRVLATAQWYVSYGTNGKPTPAKFLTAWNRTIAYAPTFIADVNGDGKADLIGRTQATGQWLVGVAPATRGAAVITTNRGAPGYFYTDIFVGDFNHDGKTDIAGIRTGSGVWTVGLSTGTDFLFGDWDLWPTTNSRITIRRARVAN